MVAIFTNSNDALLNKVPIAILFSTLALTFLLCAGSFVSRLIPPFSKMTNMFAERHLEEPHSIIDWSDVACHKTSESFRELMDGYNDEKFLLALLEQQQMGSQITHKNYKNFNRSIIIFLVGVTTSIIYVFIEKLLAVI